MIFDQYYAMEEKFFCQMVDSANLSFDAKQFDRQANITGVSQVGTSAVISIDGPIQQKLDFFMRLFGGTSTDDLQSKLADAAANTQAENIVLNIQSPGGSVYGVSETASMIREVAKVKPVYAIANSYAASAAYWLGSAATKLYVTPSGEVGSIGVIMVHTDISKMVENEGIKYTMIKSGKNKGEGNPYEPISQDTLDFLQSRADDYYVSFVSHVATGRGVSSKDVENNFGQGRMFGADAALKSGLVDGIDTLSGLLARSSIGKTPYVKSRSYRANSLQLMSMNPHGFSNQ